MLPEELLQSFRAFQDSRTLLTAVELDVFTAMGDGCTAAELATRIKADPRAAEMLLNALVALEVLDKRDDLYANRPVAERYLATDSPDSARMALMHYVNLWTRWSSLTDCVRAGGAARLEPPAQRSPEWTEAFIAAMHYNAQTRAPDVVHAIDTRPVKRMLDVGGGSGAYSMEFAKTNPHLHADLFDLGPVVAIASRHIKAAGLEGRISTIEGDLHKDPFGSGYDLVFVSAICHMLSPEDNLKLFRKCYEALNAGGRAVIQDFILNAEKTSPKFAALFSLNMLVGTDRGASYSEPEYRTWLEKAGFREVKRISIPGPSDLMQGTR